MYDIKNKISYDIGWTTAQTLMNRQKAIDEKNASAQALAHAEMREDTAIQRQVADLKGAGLNPILATNYSGSSSAASVQNVDSAATRKMANAAEKNANANMMNAYTNMFNSAVRLARK